MMLQQHPGAFSLGEMSAAALVPCLSPPGSLTLDDFTSFSHPLVKEELRLAITAKRLNHGLSTEMSDGASSSNSDRTSEYVKREATPAESDRRKRRRERNKVAAAKCRNKKKEKTDGLQQESEKLESVNAELKAQIQDLKAQKQQLVYMLNLHRPTCIVRAQNGQTPEDERTLFIQGLSLGGVSQQEGLGLGGFSQGGLGLESVTARAVSPGAESGAAALEQLLGLPGTHTSVPATCGHL